MYNIILAPNAFKGSLSAGVICRILAAQLKNPGNNILYLPQGDGGDGTASIIASYLNARKVNIRTCDPLGRPNKSCYYKSGDIAVIELAAVCGLKWLQREEYDVMNADTTGLGMAILHAIKEGARKIILCVGGSASIDGGIGALEAMGLQVVNSSSIYRNKIIEIQDIDPSYLQYRFKDIEWTVLCDVDNPLCGELGSARVFGPQKGALPSQVSLLDDRLSFYAGLLLSTTGIDVMFLKRSGAAGGIAAAFAALFSAKLQSGADYCLALSGFDEHLKHAHLVITGEGKIDRQSLSGKIPGEIAARCFRSDVKVIAVAGTAEKDITAFNRLYLTTDFALSIEESLRHPEYYINILGEHIKKDLPQFFNRQR